MLEFEYKKDNAELKLIKSALQGSSSAFDKLWEKYYKKVFNSVYCYVRNYTVIDPNSETQDIVTDVLIKVFNNLSTYDHRKAKLYTWIKRITSNTCMNWSRKAKRRIKLSRMDIDSYEEFIDEHKIDREPLAIIMLDEVQDAINEALYLIKNENYKFSLMLGWLAGFRNPEIVDFIGRKIGTVKSDNNRGKQEFYKIYKQNIEYDLVVEKELILEYCDSGGIRMLSSEIKEISNEILELRFIQKLSLNQISNLKNISEKEIKDIIKKGLEEVLKLRIEEIEESKSGRRSFFMIKPEMCIPKQRLSITTGIEDIETIRNEMCNKIKSKVKEVFFNSIS